MYRELSLQISHSLFNDLEIKAKEQGVSLEALCLSLLSGGNDEKELVDPPYYQSLNLDVLRKEIHKVIESALPKDEVRKRLNALEFQISRRYIR